MTNLIHCRAFDVPPDETRLAYREQRDKTRDDIVLMSAQIKAAAAVRMPLIYGVLREESPVVKIGTSTVLPSQASWPGRLVRLGQVRLVAVAPGDRHAERQVHERLASSRIRMDDLPGSGVTEHFRITDEVVEWINETRDAIALDPITADELLGYSA